MGLLGGKVVLCLGDSITAGALSSSSSNSYVGKLKELSGANVIGYGSGGSRIARQSVPSANPVLDRDFILRADEMQDYADYVLVFGGTNDFGHGDAPLGKMGDDTPYTFYGALNCLYTKLRNKYPMARLVAITPLHREFELVKCEKGNVVVPLCDYVQAIKQVANAFSIPVLDLYSIAEMLPDIPENKAEFFAQDGLHPNDAGHLRLAKTMYDFLLNQL